MVAGESARRGARRAAAGRRATPVARAVLGLDADSRVLLFGTEGATDPTLYEALTKSR